MRVEVAYSDTDPVIVQEGGEPLTDQQATDIATFWNERTSPTSLRGRVFQNKGSQQLYLVVGQFEGHPDGARRVVLRAMAKGGLGIQITENELATSFLLVERRHS